jgi:hypothetical protein
MSRIGDRIQHNARQFLAKKVAALHSFHHKSCPITLTEMMVEKTRFGTFLLCRTITSSFADGEVTTVVEALNGEVELLLLFNFQDS